MARGRPSKKQHILDTARTLFADFGYQGTSIDLVVQSAGVSKPTVYNNFSTKQAMLLELLPQIQAEISLASEAIAAELSVEEGIIESYRLLVSRNDWLAVFRIAWGERHKLDAEVYDALEQLEQQQAHWLAQWCEQKGAGAISEDRLYLIRALCRESVVIPVISARTPDYSALQRRLEALMAAG